MRKFLLATVALGGCIGLGRGASAQGYPVYDNSNFLQAVQAVATAAKELAQLQAELQQLQRTYQMFTNPTNIIAMLPALNAPSLQNPMPAATTMPGQIVGSPTTLSNLAQTFFKLNHVFAATWQCYRILAQLASLNLRLSRLDRGAFCGLESQSGIV